MALAVIETATEPVGLELARDRNALAGAANPPVELSRLPAKSLRGAVVGVVWQELVVKRPSLPPLLGAELRRALDLQLSFHFPGKSTGLATALLHKPNRRGVEVLMLGADLGARAGCRAVFPEPIAFFALAHKLEKLPAQGAVLIAAHEANLLQTVMVIDREIVLIRRISAPGDFNLELRLAAQNVFLADASEMVEPAALLWFGLPPPEGALDATWNARLDLQPTDKLVAANGHLTPERCLVAAGLLQAAAMPKLTRKWQLRRPAAAGRQGGARLAVAAAVTLVCLATAAFWWQTRSLAGQLAACGKQQQEYAGRLADTVRLETSSTALQAFLAGDAGRLATGRRWHELLNLLEDKKSPGLTISSLNGQLDRDLLLRGRAGSYADVTAYMSALRGATLLTKVVLQSTRQATEGGVEFDLALGCNPPPAPPPAPGQEGTTP